jgi:hypothetical protein
MRKKTVFTLGAWSVVRHESLGRVSPNEPSWSVYFDGKFYCSQITKKRSIAFIQESSKIIA